MIRFLTKGNRMELLPSREFTAWMTTHDECIQEAWDHLRKSITRSEKGAIVSFLNEFGEMKTAAIVFSDRGDAFITVKTFLRCETSQVHMSRAKQALTETLFALWKSSFVGWDDRGDPNIRAQRSMMRTIERDLSVDVFPGERELSDWTNEKAEQHYDELKLNSMRGF